MSDELRKELDELRSLVNKHETRIADSSAAKPIDKGIFLKYDPFNEKNPLKVVGHIKPNAEYPAGAQVAWKNPRLREESIGWKGWEPFKLGDEYTGENGELLSQFIDSPPMHMLGGSSIDGYIRRGDLILCRIDNDIYLARQHNREMRSKIATQNVSMADVQTVRTGTATAVVEETGMQVEERPAGGFKVNEPRPYIAPVDGIDPSAQRTELLPENRSKE